LICGVSLVSIDQPFLYHLQKTHLQSMSMSITIDKIDNNVKQISTIVDLDLKQETKEVMNSLIDKIENITLDGMNSRGDNKIPRLNN
jgi:hypothetical protein